MKVKMLTTMAGPGGTHQAGKPASLPEKEALELIENGYAVEIKTEKNQVADGKPQTPGDEQPDFEEMTKAQIAAWAQEHHEIDVSTSMNKDDMIAEVHEKMAAKAEETGGE